MRKFLFSFLAINVLVILANAQGPYPPRLSIPGALAVPSRAQFRNEKVVRVRRPTLSQRLAAEEKPVTEAPEDDNEPDEFLPSLLREQQLAQAQQAQFHQQAQSFLNNEDSLSPLQLLAAQQDEPILLPTLPRFHERPTPAPQRPQNFNDYGIGSGISSLSSSRFERPEPQTTLAPPAAPQSPPPQRVRTRPSRPQYEAQAAPAPAPAPAPRPRPKPVQHQPRPSSSFEQNQLQQEERRQKPVSQTIRKWREENEDGSITWGYENDDGSFKEELIGTDCITKGTYGYVDPDGNKREYQYETGIKCDPNTRETEDEQQENNNGFINYEENKAVLPNGIEIDMSQLGKKKSKRPGVQLRYN